MISTSTRTRGNVFQLNPTEMKILVAKVDDSWLWHKIFCLINFDYIMRVSTGLPHNSYIIIMPKAILRNIVFNLRTIFPHHEVHLIFSTQGRILKMVSIVCALGS